MMKPKYLLAGLTALILSAHSALAQTTLAKWTFETTQPGVVDGPAAPGAGVYITNIVAETGSGVASSRHTTTSTYSSPAGNGSPHSFSANGWSIGDFTQYAVSTTGFTTIQVSYDQTGSGTGPAQFKLQYSVDGGATFVDVTNYTLLAGITWTSAGPVAGSSYSIDLSAITALNNVATVYFRITDTSTVAINGGTVASGGTGRVDNFAVSGNIPGPVSIAQNPINTNVNFGDTFSLTVTANGTPPLFYQWYYYTNGSPVTNALVDGSSGFGAGTITGSTNPVVTFTFADTNQSGNYFVVITNSFITPATSQVAQVSITPRAPIVTNIAYLHTLRNANFVVTDTTNLYQVEGVVTTSGDLVSSGGQSCFIQDASGGMDLFFFTGTGSYALPSIGDHVIVVGQLSQFDGGLEIQLTANPAHSLTLVSSGNALPTPRLFNFATPLPANAYEGYLTNGTTVVSGFEGAYVVISNVFLGITNVNQTDALLPDQSVFMTNLTGQTFVLRVPNNGLANSAFAPLPGPFAASVVGVMAQLQTSGAVLTNTYQIYYDLQANVTVGSPPVNLVSPKITTIKMTTDGFVISGTNNNGTTAGHYAVLVSTNFSLPLSNWTPVITQAFNADGTLGYTNPPGSDNQRFYILQALP